MKLIYIAGAFSGDILRNIQRARAIADQLARARVAYYLPHADGLHNAALRLPEEYWLASTMEVLKRCDAVQLVPGWEGSTGTQAEIDAALALKKSVFQPDEIGKCIAWAKGRFPTVPNMTLEAARMQAGAAGRKGTRSRSRKGGAA